MLSFSLDGAEDPAPVVLYLHGLGIAGWSWAPVRTALPEFGALVPDLPGHGASAHVAWHSIADTAAKVAEVVDTLPSEKTIHITGHSLGAYVGLILLQQRPERFAHAVLSGFHVGSVPNKNLLKLAYVANGMIFSVPPLLRRFAKVFGDEEAARRFVEGAKVIKPRTVRRAGIQVVDFVAPSEPCAGAIAVLAVAGDGEPDAIRTTPEKLAANFPNVRAQVLQGRDHLWPVKEPLLYAELLQTHFGGIE